MKFKIERPKHQGYYWYIDRNYPDPAIGFLGPLRKFYDMISISMDDGKTWISCPEGVRVNIEKQILPGEDSTGDLVFNFTHEGVITDIWRVVPETQLDENVGTESEMYSDIIDRLIEDNS